MTEQVVLGVITARGGSKSVPKKNLYSLAGKPLIAHSIVSARDATVLDRFIVSTDDEEIAAVSREHGAEVPFMRPPELAEDDTPDLPVFEHAVRWLWEHEQYRPEILVHLRPTQPLRQGYDIDEVVRMLVDTGADSVKSVRPVKEHPHKMWRIQGDRLQPYLQTEFRRFAGPDHPRQYLEQVYVSTGVVDTFWRSVMEAGSTAGTDSVPYITDPVKSLDLDDEDDFIVAESILRVHALKR